MGVVLNRNSVIWSALSFLHALRAKTRVSQPHGSAGIPKRLPSGPEPTRIMPVPTMVVSRLSNLLCHRVLPIPTSFFGLSYPIRFLHAQELYFVPLVLCAPVFFVVRRGRRHPCPYSEMFLCAPARTTEHRTALAAGRCNIRNKLADSMRAVGAWESNMHI